MKNRSNVFLVLSGPSGVGKTTVAKKFVTYHKEFKISISTTTRPKRVSEKNGIDYYFIDKEQFKQEIANDYFLEYEHVHGYYYGTSKSSVDELLKQGKSIIFDIDVKGAMKIKQKFPDTIMIFIKPPSMDELRLRLSKRASESKDDIKKRLRRLEFEYDYGKNFTYIIINDSLAQTIEEIRKIVANHKEKPLRGYN